MTDKLAGKRILVVEDEPLVAMLIEDMLLDSGVEVIGPATNVEQALELVRSEALDCAILDVNLNGARSLAIADELSSRSVPFLFATGYGSTDYGAPHSEAPVVAKPYRQEEVHRALTALLERQ